MNTISNPKDVFKHQSHVIRHLLKNPSLNFVCELCEKAREEEKVYSDSPVMTRMVESLISYEFKGVI